MEGPLIDTVYDYGINMHYMENSITVMGKVFHLEYAVSKVVVCLLILDACDNNYVSLISKLKEGICELVDFYKAVVEYEEFPLNVSSEMLQQNKKCMKLIEKISLEEENYKKFLESWSKNMKLNTYGDLANRKELAGYLRYYTNAYGDDYFTACLNKPQDKFFLRSRTIMEAYH